jgi:hypothetical protein
MAANFPLFAEVFQNRIEEQAWTDVVSSEQPPRLRRCRIYARWTQAATGAPAGKSIM